MAKQLSIAQELAALIYYDRLPKLKAGEKIVQFEDLPEDKQDPFHKEAGRFLLRLDKMNRMIVKKASEEDRKAKEEQTLEILTQIIRGFVKDLNTTRPELFPCEELALKILGGPDGK
jgi:hypothetical protein